MGLLPYNRRRPARAHRTVWPSLIGRACPKLRTANATTIPCTGRVASSGACLIQDCMRPPTDDLAERPIEHPQ